MKHQFEGQVIANSRSKVYNQKTFKYETSQDVLSMVEFLLEDNQCVSFHVKGKYELGTKFLMDIYPIPAFTDEADLNK